MRTEGLVRDLRAGSCRALVAGGERPWHRRGKELVKKLATQGRLISFPPALPTDPVDDHGWCDEAIATHAKLPLTGAVIVTQPIKDAHRSEPFVASIDRLDGAAWWSPGDPSIRLGRNVQEYRQHLGLILRHANSIQFIDPHLGPTKPRYSGVVELMRAAGRENACTTGRNPSGGLRGFRGPEELPRYRSSQRGLSGHTCQRLACSWFTRKRVRLGPLPRSLPDQQSGRDLPTEWIRYVARERGNHDVDGFGTSGSR